MCALAILLIGYVWRRQQRKRERALRYSRELENTVRVRTHELRRAQSAAAGPQSREERLRRAHEPRAAHADERRARHDGAAARYAARRRATTLLRGHSSFRRFAARDRRRRARFLEDRSGPPAARSRRVRPGRARGADGGNACGARGDQGHRTAVRFAGAAAAARSRRCRSAAPGARQSRRQCREVHRSRPGDAARDAARQRRWLDYACDSKWSTPASASSRRTRRRSSRSSRRKMRRRRVASAAPVSACRSRARSSS